MQPWKLIATSYQPQTYGICKCISSRVSQETSHWGQLTPVKQSLASDPLSPAGSAYRHCNGAWHQRIETNANILSPNTQNKPFLSHIQENQTCSIWQKLKGISLLFSSLEHSQRWDSFHTALRLGFISWLDIKKTYRQDSLRREEQEINRVS